MRIFIITLLVILLATNAPVTAQSVTCTPQRFTSMVWGPDGSPIVPVAKYWTVAANGFAGDPNGFVPPGEVWLIKAAGGFSNVGTSRDWMFQIEHHWADQSACCFLTPLHRLQGNISATPQIALPRPILLEEGERLSIRTNVAAGQIGFMQNGWKFPAACLPRLIGVEANTSTGGPVAMPDFGPLSQALQQVVTALDSLP